MTLTVLALATVAACRSRGNDLPVPDKPATDKPPPGGEDGGDGDGGPATPGKPGDAGGGEGPKLMGYEYPFRVSYGPMTGTYNDTENNQTAHRKVALKGVHLKGTRYVFEHYPIVRENFPHSDYGYAVAELRDEKTDKDYWSKRQTAVLLMGYILPTHRIIAPVLGLHWEFDKVSLDKDDSPEVSKADLRALVLGVDTRQKLWGTGDWLAAFYGLKLHLLNPAQKSTGLEFEVNLGMTVQFEFVRTDFTIGYLEQRYDGERESPDKKGNLGVQSRARSTLAMVTLWI